MFDTAFNYAMKWEVGPLFNPSDPDVQQGLIMTQLQRRKVGYTNIANDAGGETKFGVASKSHPNINIATLTLEQAKTIYKNDYWQEARCDILNPAVAIMHFDGAVNHGVWREIKFLEQVANQEIDGKFDSGLLSVIAKMNPKDVILGLAEVRKNFYNSIVAARPNQKMFLTGWMSRVNDVSKFAISQI